ncbi:MAG TPA: hypothetical protein VFO38_02390 [Candidatus Saccharimonadales bacterium]|nr:hypothetical protein [Candidatus Saccharimonadales bacterium]
MTKKKQEPQEKDSAYLLKIVLYIVLGSFWLKFSQPVQIGDIMVHGFPLGLIIGLLFASHDHFQVDRKIEFAILIVITVITFFVPAGIVI